LEAAGKNAWEWHCEPECIGLHNIRAMLAHHESDHPERRHAVADVPTEFVRDWLEFHDRRAGRLQMLWRASVLVLAGVAAGASLTAACR